MLDSSADRSARAVCAVAVTESPDSVEVFTGEVAGRIAARPRGTAGFGWDSIFIPDGSRQTYAEMGEEKNHDSHRARAFKAARRRLAEY